MQNYIYDQPGTVLRHQELLLLNTFVSEAAAEVEHSLNETRENSSDLDWQYLKGQNDALREVSKKIRSIMAADDRQYDRFILKPSGEVKQAEEAA